ncbi:MAG: hypothetical protein ACFCU1_06190 [Sumerlaeia bacterium]
MVGIITVFWFLWGGFRDLRELFVSLKNAKRDEHDDGIVHHDE